MDEGGRRSFDATDTWGPLEQEDGEANGVSMVLRPSFQSLQPNKELASTQPLDIFFIQTREGLEPFLKRGMDPTHPTESSNQTHG